MSDQEQEARLNFLRENPHLRFLIKDPVAYLKTYRNYVTNGHNVENLGYIESHLQTAKRFITDFITPSQSMNEATTSSHLTPPMQVPLSTRTTRTRPQLTIKLEPPGTQPDDVENPLQKNKIVVTTAPGDILIPTISTDVSPPGPNTSSLPNPFETPTLISMPSSATFVREEKVPFVLPSEVVGPKFTSIYPPLPSPISPSLGHYSPEFKMRRPRMTLARIDTQMRVNQPEFTPLLPSPVMPSKNEKGTIVEDLQQVRESTIQILDILNTQKKQALEQVEMLNARLIEREESNQTVAVSAMAHQIDEEKIKAVRDDLLLEITLNNDLNERLNTLESEKAKNVSQINNLELELQSKNAMMARLNLEIEQSNRQATDQQRNMNEYVAREEKLIAQSKVYKAQIDQYRSEGSMLESKYNSNLVELSQSREMAAILNQQIKETTTKANLKIDMLDAQRRDLELLLSQSINPEQVRQYESSLQQVMIQLNEVTEANNRQLQNFNNSQLEFEKQRLDLERNLAETKVTLTRSNYELAQKTEQLNETAKLVDMVAREFENYKRDSLHLQDNLEALKLQEANLTAQLETERRNMTTLSEERVTFLADTERLAKELGESRATEQALREQLLSIQAIPIPQPELPTISLAQLQEQQLLAANRLQQIQEMRDMSDELQKELDRANLRAREAERNGDLRGGDLQKSQAELLQLKSVLNALQRNLKNSQRINEELEDTHRKEVVEHMQQLEQFRKTSNEAVQQRNIALQSIFEKGAQLEAKNAELAEKTVRIEDLEEQKRKGIAAFREINIKNIALTQRNSAAADQTLFLQRQVQILQTEIEELKLLLANQPNIADMNHMNRGEDTISDVLEDQSIVPAIRARDLEQEQRLERERLNHTRSLTQGINVARREFIVENNRKKLFFRMINELEIQADPNDIENLWRNCRNLLVRNPTRSGLRPKITNAAQRDLKSKFTKILVAFILRFKLSEVPSDSRLLYATANRFYINYINRLPINGSNLTTTEDNNSTEQSIEDTLPNNNETEASEVPDPTEQPVTSRLAEEQEIIRPPRRLPPIEKS